MAWQTAGTPDPETEAYFETAEALRLLRRARGLLGHLHPTFSDVDQAVLAVSVILDELRERGQRR